MLTKDPRARVNANDALKHPWFAKYNSLFASKEEQNENLIQSLRNLKNFSAETTLQRAVLGYIATQEIDPREEKRLKLLFDSLDVNKSGQVTLNDLLEGYKKIYKDEARAQKVAEQIMKRADINNNGCIDYSGKALLHARVPNGLHGSQPRNHRRNAQTRLRLLRRSRPRFVIC
eukprot:TRINITY_DN6396_c0_g1_i5.p3 TRINITY_DN6396_c0_g1~~TRINITY_DN6396_c0_g1_i5.p3  ORF type:complete len:174 (+),score=43.45 TRINITY_DN6396_c0_g1_i5:1342-1863(+)